MKKNLILKCIKLTDEMQSRKIKSKGFIEVTETDTQAFFLKNKNDLTIVFNATEIKFTDILTDMLFFKSEIPYQGTNKNIKVHFGFLFAYKSIRQKLHEFVKKNENIKTINFFGHSLGGALATLASLDIQFNFPDKKIDVVTIGQPKVGNKYFVNSFNKRVTNFIRYVYSEDIVTKIPFGFVGYKHVGKEIHLGNKAPFWNLFLKLIGRAKDHLTSNYYKEIEKEKK